MKTENYSSEMLLEVLRLCEERVWNALLLGDSQADAAALDDCFLGVYPDGFAAKADHVHQLSDGPTIQSYQLSGFRILPLTADHAVLSYRAEFQRPGRTRVEAVYVSSIWRRHEGDWVNVFSQDTPAAD